MIEIRENGSHKPPIDEVTIVSLLIVGFVAIIALINGV